MGASRVAVLGAACAAAGCLALPALPSSAPFTKRGTVIQVLDAQTIAVRSSAGAITRVHVLGIKGPAADECGFATATADITDLAAGQLAWLVGDPAQPVHDSRGRLIAYVVLPRGLDLGLELVKRGDARLDPAVRAFKQLHVYRKAQAKAEAASLGVWACGTSSPAPGAGPAPKGNPHPATPPGQQQQQQPPPPQQQDHGNSSKNR